MDCIVLTYDVPHRKTYDVLCRLKSLGYNDVFVWAVPMHYKKTFVPLYEHRPPAYVEIETKKQCVAFGYMYLESANGYDGLPGDKEVPVLLCGAGLLPEKLIKSRRIINSHPGYIPLARGLDALKWEIYENLPIGVTTHLIGDEVDAGEIIERKEVPIYENDTFHALAQRVYETEVSMLVDSLRFKGNGDFFVAAGDNKLHRRMPKEIEAQLMDRFFLLREARGVDRTLIGKGRTE